MAVYQFLHWEDGSTNPTRTLQVFSDLTITATYQLVEVIKGYLEITTTPVSGEVFLNNVSQGFAPITLQLDPGFYVVSFGTMLGYTAPYPQAVDVIAGLITPVVGTYVAIPSPPPGTGAIVIDSSPFKVQALLDGAFVGVTPVTVGDVAPGLHVVTFEVIKGFNTPSPITVTVIEGYTSQALGNYTLAQIRLPLLALTPVLAGIVLAVAGR